MWERLHVQVTMEQMKWLRAEAFTGGKSIGEIIRNLIGAAMSRRNKNNESKNSTPRQETDTKWHG